MILRREKGFQHRDFAHLIFGTKVYQCHNEFLNGVQPLWINHIQFKPKEINTCSQLMLRNNWITLLHFISNSEEDEFSFWFTLLIGFDWDHIKDDLNTSSRKYKHMICLPEMIGTFNVFKGYIDQIHWKHVYPIHQYED